MSFSEDPSLPPDHPISLERARQLMGGDRGKEYRSILNKCVAPLYWHGPCWDYERRICSSGTLTFVRTSERVFGVTAAHVLRDYRRVKSEPGVRCQLLDELFEPEVIDQSKDLDLATVAITPEVVAGIGKEVVPVPLARPGDTPQEGRGIMLCGYPGQDRDEQPGLNVVWGLFTVLGVARRVNAKQITWVPDPKHNVPTEDVQIPPPNKELGGISGGPLIARYGKAGGMRPYYSLAGVVVEASAALENVVAIRAEFIRPDGTIGPV